MTGIEESVNEALSEALSSDTGLAERTAAVDFVHRWNAIAPAHLRKTPDEVLAAFDLTPSEVAARLGLDPHMVEDFMSGDLGDDIELPPTSMHGFDDTFGRPTT